jgi:hypothetical protein
MRSNTLGSEKKQYYDPKKQYFTLEEAADLIRSFLFQRLTDQQKTFYSELCEEKKVTDLFMAVTKISDPMEWKDWFRWLQSCGHSITLSVTTPIQTLQTLQHTMQKAEFCIKIIKPNVRELYKVSRSQRLTIDTTPFLLMSGDNTCKTS